MGAIKSPGTTSNRRDLLKLAALGAGAASGGLALPAPAAAAAAAPGDVPPMRSRPEGRAGETPLTVPSLAGIVLNRAAFGPWPGDIAAFNALGTSDDQRLQAWVDTQLNPAAIPDPDCDARLANSGFTTLNKTLEQLWAQHILGNPPWEVRMRPFWETQRATFIRAVYSRRQLKEVLADFWHNHFNVFGDDSIQGPVFVHYDRDVIRANMLGNFRAMLEAVARSTGMMYMLDNYTSSVTGPNENFARELFELHTMGAENYFGVMRQDDVPVDPQGRPLGYVDADVFEATRCFTGWSVANGQSGAPNTGALPLPGELARPLPEARAEGLHPPGPARPRGRPHGARHAGRAPGHRPLRLPQAVPPADRRHAQPGDGGRGGPGVLRPARRPRPAPAGGAGDPAVRRVPRHLGDEGQAPLRAGGERDAGGGGAVPLHHRQRRHRYLHVALRGHGPAALHPPQPGRIPRQAGVLDGRPTRAWGAGACARG